MSGWKTSSLFEDVFEVPPKQQIQSVLLWVRSGSEQLQLSGLVGVSGDDLLEGGRF